jgi:hypothetical protein
MRRPAFIAATWLTMVCVARAEFGIAAQPAVQPRAMRSADSWIG